MRLFDVKFRLAGVLMVGLAVYATGLRAQDKTLQVKTDTGVVQGVSMGDAKVIAFKGIPFAAPPVGDLRWKPPQPVQPWTGVRAAKGFGYHCVQSSSYADMQFHDPGPSEDCLTLNVWTPAGAKGRKLPVMVWIYGGGFLTGGTSEYRQNGQFLARRDVVVASMNYRLGIFGFMVHPELTAESGKHASGNYGLMDIAAALEWVKRNAAAFGGDAGNVTLFGESAGSFAVSAEMAAPRAKGLFAKAIGESGGAFYSGSLGYRPRAEREVADMAFAQAIYGTAKLAELRARSTEDLVRGVTAKTNKPATRFGPDIDGDFLPDSVPNTFAAGKQAQVPLLAGWNADEGRGAVTMAKEKLTAAAFAEQARKEFGDRSSDFLSVYKDGTDAEAQVSAGDYGGDKFIAYSTWRWLEAQVKTGRIGTGKAPVYRYFFALGSPGDRNHAAALGAFHSDEIEYVFGTLDSRAEAVWRPEDRKLSDQIGQYWTNFARTGDPNGEGLPKWPRYAPTDFQVMHLAADSIAHPDTTRERYLFLDSVWGK